MRRAAACACALWLAAAAPVTVSGLVRTPATLTEEALGALPAATVEARFGTMRGEERHTWRGPLLWEVLGRAGIVDAPGKRTFARHTVLVTGADGYGAALAIGEIDPQLEGKRAILAVADEAGPLPAPRLIVPGDGHGARQVRDVVAVELR
jgi:DMSO/TMAO reductase YedYZ molybdopterin-dependent catalytic subunit